MKTNISRGVAVALSLILSLLCFPAVASPGDAGGVSISDAEEAEIREFWTTYGVPFETQNSLMEKYLETGVLDVFKGGEPVEVESLIVDGSSVAIERFEDGSVRVSSVEIPTPIEDQNARTISGCTNTSGSGYAIAKGCKIQTGDGVRFINFRADWAAYSGGNAELLRTYNPDAYGSGGTMTIPTRTYWRPQSTSTQSARATYTSIWKGKHDLSSESMHATLWLTRSGIPSVGSS